MGAVAVLGGLSALENPVFTVFPISYARTEGIGPTRAFGEFLFFYLDPTARQLRFDPELGVASLREARAGCERDDSDLFDCGRIAWHAGDFRLATSRFEALVRRDGGSERALLWLGLSQMRLGEAENCLEHALGGEPMRREPPRSSGGESTRGAATESEREDPMCSLPIRAFHTDDTFTLEAARTFARLSDRYGPSPLYRWLVNFAYMPANRFPDGVPERFVLPEDNRFRDLFHGERARWLADRYAFLSLRDVAPEAGVDWSRVDGRPSSGRGTAVADFDGDGCLDIVTGGVFGTVSLFVNTCAQGAPLRFVDRSVASGLASVTSAHIITAADYDDDGSMDLFVGRHYGSPRGDFKLLRNRGDGTFEDVTRSAGLIAPSDARYYQTWGSAWGDVDGDGDLDLFVANWVMHNANLKSSFTHIWKTDENAPSMLFRNDGGHFSDVTDAYGLSELADHNVIGVAFGDYDDDGFVDLAATLLYSPGVALFRNRAGKGFERVPVASPGVGFMTSFVDVNHDGRLDLFVGGMAAAATATERAIFGTGQAHTGSRILIQREGGTFEQSPTYFGDELPIPTMGVSFGDLDHDGAIDWYLGTGNPEGALVVPNLLYMGRPNAELGSEPGTDNVSMLQGVGTIQKGHGIVFADLDGDGDQDVYSALGGFWPGDRWPNQLFLNETPQRGHSVRLELCGCASNRFGLGASIEVRVRRPDGSAMAYHYLMDNKTGFGSAPYVADIGLGDAEAIERIRVKWIGPSAQRIEYRGVPLDTHAVLAEGGAIAESRSAARASCDAMTRPSRDSQPGAPRARRADARIEHR